MLVRGAQRCQVQVPGRAPLDEGDATPGERLPAEAAYEQIGGKSRVSTVAVGERVDRYPAVMESDCRLVGLEGSVRLYPQRHIGQQVADGRADLPVLDPKIAR